MPSSLPPQMGMHATGPFRHCVFELDASVWVSRGRAVCGKILRLHWVGGCWSALSFVGIGLVVSVVHCDDI